jgi:hypothetical protein
VSIVYGRDVPRYGRVDHDYGARLATCPPEADGPVYMLNLMKYRESAAYDDGADGGISGREADDAYDPSDVLADIGARIVFVGDVLQSHEPWDRVAVVRYPTRRSFIEMQSRRDFQDKHVHKEAGMDHTIVMGTLPVGDLPAKAKPRRTLLEVWADGAAEDGFHVEGTIIGDGRTWSRARYTTLDDDGDVPTGDDHHQVLVVQAYLDQWQ